MYRRMCKGKIHRATVTEADLNYVGSITLDPHLMREANILPYEMVQVTNLANGIIWHTYAISGLPDSGTVCLNGPPARHFQPGDLIIVLSLCYLDAEELSQFTSKVVFVNDENRVQRVEEFIPSDEWLTFAGVTTSDTTSAQVGTSEAAGATNIHGTYETSRGRDGASSESEDGHRYP